MFKFKDDKTESVLTAKSNIASAHRGAVQLTLPETAIVFFMGGGVEYLLENYNHTLITDKFPRFLQRCPQFTL